MTSPFASRADDLRYVAWRTEMRGDKPTKVPYGAGRRRAKADDPATWLTREEAEKTARRIVNGQGGGIGIMLGDLGADLYLAGLDLDSCNEDGVLAPWAAAILDVIDTYAEISPSGYGIKAFCYIESEAVRPFLDRIGVPADGWGCRRGIPGHDSKDHGPAVECYCNRRYFAVTEHRWLSAPDTIRMLDAATLDRLADMIPPPAAAPQAGENKRQGGDTSRSGIAFNKVLAWHRAGTIKTYEEMVSALYADPETAEWTREKGEPAGQRELHRLWDKSEAKAEPAPSDDALALRFTEAHPELRHVAIWNRWLMWGQGLWAADLTLQVFDLARQLCRETPSAKKDAKTVAAIANLARADRRHAMTSEDWDTADDFMATKGK